MTETEPKYANVYQTPDGEQKQGAWNNRNSAEFWALDMPSCGYTPLYRIKCMEKTARVDRTGDLSVVDRMEIREQPVTGSYGRLNRNHSKRFEQRPQRECVTND